MTEDEKERSALRLLRQTFYSKGYLYRNIKGVTDGRALPGYPDFRSELDWFSIPHIYHEDPRAYYVEHWAFELISYALNISEDFSGYALLHSTRTTLVLLFMRAKEDNEWKQAWITLVDQGLPFLVHHAFIRESVQLFVENGET